MHGHLVVLKKYRATSAETNFIEQINSPVSNFESTPLLNLQTIQAPLSGDSLYILLFCDPPKNLIFH